MHLLVYDAPNIDQTISAFVGGKPTQDDRPDLKALMSWFLARSGDEESKACVFVNIQPDGETDNLKRWLHFLRSTGYYVFLKPRNGDSDIDDEMIEFINQGINNDHSHLEIVVVSNDAQNFFRPMRKWAEEGIHCMSIGFEENAGDLSSDDLIRFIDLEDEEQIPGLFKRKLEGRLKGLDLATLPVEGVLIPPLGRFS